MDADPALHTTARGEGPLIVWSHGFGGSGRNFGPQVRALRDRYQVVSYDARGHARSRDVVAGGFALEALVEDLAGVVAAHGPGSPAILGGLSLGAAVSLRFALAYPERVRALILASLPAGVEVAGSISFQAEAFAAALDAGGLEGAGARFVWGEASGLDARGAGLVRQGFLEHSATALAAILRETLSVLAAPASLAASLGETGIPVLLIAGGDDVPSLVAARELATALPEARLEVITGAGHIVNLAAPLEFNACVEAFLSAL